MLRPVSHPPTRRRVAERKHAALNPTIAVAERFARQLADLRIAAGETQKQLAVRLGMTESMISRFESGDHLPNITTLCRIAAAFDRRLEIAFHEHEHEHADGTRYRHVHKHDDGQHGHPHDETRR